MSSRYTDRDVRNAFEWFVLAARDAGINTQGWTLHGGNSSFGYNWRIVSPRPQVVNHMTLGITKREAYNALRLAERALVMVRESRSE